MNTGSRDEALAQIVNIARAHTLTPKEIAEALAEPREGLARNKALLFFSALGGIFIFAGIGAFITMFWGEMNSAARVIITLGSGFILFVMGVLAAHAEDTRYRKACMPLLAMAAWLQPTGLFVFIYEYFHNGGDPRYAALFVFGIMLIQQLASFSALRRTVLLFFALVFGGFFFTTVFSLLGVPNEWNSAIIGFSFLNISYGLARYSYRNLPGFGFFVSGCLFLGGIFDVLKHSPLELLYLGLVGFMVYLSTVVRSTALMVVSVIAMLSYIGYFTEEHFVHSIGWPAALIILGLVFIGVGAGALKIKKKYI